ncbi:MAG TPA: MBL fold metallo-hydrolase [Pyrinomonadaceae bacterium]|nr:MBL fold metallo-hydrolase [Pyrinomonadaceae bacterium]
MRLFYRLLTILVLMTFAAGVALAQRRESVMEKSSRRAREVLMLGVKAMGGVEALQKIEDVTRELSGTRMDEGQGMEPVLPRAGNPPQTNHPKIKSIRDVRGQRTLDETEDVIFGGQPIKSRVVVAANAAFFVSEVTKTMRLPPPPAVASFRASRFRRYPETLLLVALNRPETLRWLGEGEADGRPQNVISFADADGSEVALYFDSKTNLLTKTESLADDQVLGDVALETIYGDWRAVEKLMLPFRLTDRVGGVVQQELQTSSITLNTHPPDSLFRMPEGYAKIDPAPPVPTVKKLADDVYAILGPYNSLFVVFKEYVLVIEAGFNNRYSRASIDEIKKVAPDKPIRYLVSTHFHFDHLSGVRSYIAAGATIVTTTSAQKIVEYAAAAPHLMRPDALAREPKRPTVETFKDKRVFDDGAHRVELYQISSPHVGEMIVAYLPHEKLLFEADMLDIPEAGTPPAGDDTADLAQQVKRLGLDVEHIIPVHGRMGTAADLAQALTNQSSRK